VTFENRLTRTLALPAIRLSAVLAGLLAVSACKTSSLGTAGKIVQLNLITVPVALDLDGQPGPDGVSVKLYATAEGNPKPVPIRQGTLEVLLFDGPFQRQKAHPPILKQFHFSATELRQMEFTAKIGIGYQLALPWGTNLPSHRIMSVAARYSVSPGNQVSSQPSSVTVLAK
jgi:hypothetical protein